VIEDSAAIGATSPEAARTVTDARTDPSSRLGYRPKQIVLPGWTARSS
jgi:hypothetical protein